MERHVNPEDPDLYALGALDGEERRAFEAHVNACPECARLLAAARLRAHLPGLTTPAALPPPRVKDALLRQIRQQSPSLHVTPARRPLQAPPPTIPAPPAPSPRRWAWLTPVLATASLVLASLCGWLWTLNLQYARQNRDLRVQLSLAESRTQQMAATRADFERMMGQPRTIHVALAPQPGSSTLRAGILYNQTSGALVWTGYLPPPPPNKSYQLWLVPASGAPISLKVFPAAEQTAVFTTHIAPGLAAKAFAVTVEPYGGRPQPTGPKVLVGLAG